MTGSGEGFARLVGWRDREGARMCGVGMFGVGAGAGAVAVVVCAGLGTKRCGDDEVGLSCHLIWRILEGRKVIWEQYEISIGCSGLNTSEAMLVKRKHVLLGRACHSSSRYVFGGHGLGHGLGRTPLKLADF